MNGRDLTLVSLVGFAVAGIVSKRRGGSRAAGLFNDLVLPAGTPLWHATRATFKGLPTSPRGDRPTWFGLGRAETLWYATSSWRDSDEGLARLIEAVATRDLVLPNVTGDYGGFARALGAAVVTPEALMVALRERGQPGWAVASRTTGFNADSAVAIVDPEVHGVRFVRSINLEER